MLPRLVLTALVGIVSLASSALSVRPTRAAPLTRVHNGLIAFMRHGTVGEYDLWVVRPDGTGLRRLTTAPRDRSDYNPTWSPDGSQLLFERRVLTSQGDTLFTVPATGGSLHQLTRCSGTCWSHNEGSWSR